MAQGFTQPLTANSPPLLPGMMIDYAGTAVPTGYLACDGSAVSRTTYAALFTAISTTWGSGDGSTTFNVPNFQRRTAVGSGGSGTGTLGASVGNIGGEENHVQSLAELAAHSHSITAGNITILTSPDSNTGSTAISKSANNNNASQTSVGMSGSVNSAGSSTAFNVMQPSAVVLKIIKY